MPIKKGKKQSYLILLVALFLCSMALAAHGQMSALEKDIFLAVYRMPEGLRTFALLVTQLGSAWVLIGLVALLLVLRWNPKLALQVLANGAVAYSLTEVFKAVVARPRPFELFADVVSRQGIVDGFGFPSGHTAVAAAMSLTLLPYLPKKWRWLPIPWIVLVAWSRVYLGVHAPLDVVGGFALGVLTVILLGDRVSRFFEAGTHK